MWWFKELEAKVFVLFSIDFDLHIRNMYSPKTFMFF